MAEEVKQTIAPKDPVVEEGIPFAVISYLWILCLVPLLLKKDNKFAHFHGKQGLVLAIVETALIVLWAPLMFIPILGWLLLLVLDVALVVFAIIGIIQALMGNYYRLPIVADFADKFKI